MVFNPWLTFSLFFLLLWTIIWLFKKDLRKEMLMGSLVAAPFGLTEPLFVPEYWSPPSLFNLAAITGIDLESIIFCFAIGGIGIILYEIFFKTKHVKISVHEQKHKHHRFHFLALTAGPIVFLILLFLTSWNAIYSASIAMLIGAIAAMLCRPDLIQKIMISGLLFLGIYFIFFFSFTLVYPGIVEQVWNLAALSGILIIGIPLEEFMFAFAFGMFWSSIYEHFYWYKLQ